MEEIYNLEDALVVAMFLMSFIRHSDCVKIANLAQLVNVIGPVMTRGDELFKQTIFHAFRMISSRKTGVSLRGAVIGPSYASERFGEVPYLDHAAILDGDRLHVFAVNRSLDEDMRLVVDLDRSIAKVVTAELLHAELRDENGLDVPDRVASAPFDGWAVQGSAEAVFAAALVYGNDVCAGVTHGGDASFF